MLIVVVIDQGRRINFNVENVCSLILGLSLVFVWRKQ